MQCGWPITKKNSQIEREAHTQALWCDRKHIAVIALHKLFGQLQNSDIHINGYRMIITIGEELPITAKTMT